MIAHDDTAVRIINLQILSDYFILLKIYYFVKLRACERLSHREIMCRIRKGIRNRSGVAENSEFLEALLCRVIMKPMHSQAGCCFAAIRGC